MSGRRLIGFVLAFGTGCGPGCAQTNWFAEGHTAAIHVVGATRGTLSALRDETQLPAGSYGVHFGANSAGKPESLAIDVLDADEVRLAVGRAAPVVGEWTPIDGDAWRPTELATSALPMHARTTGSPALANARIAATVRGNGTDGAFGLIARHSDAGHGYQLVWDRARREVRLERRLGPDTMVITRVPAPAHDDQPHTLALQFDGFRLTASFDEAPLLQALDGALTAGSVGIFWTGEPPVWERFAIEPVAKACGSVAVVRRPGVAILHAAAVVSPGHFHVLELLLDRPHPLIPRGPNGLELFLLQRPAAPTCLLADWRGSLGDTSIGEVPTSGRFESDLRWPDLPALRREAVLVRALLVSADGEALVDTTPAVPLVF